MNWVTVKESEGVLQLPDGVTVGDEFRVVGRVLVTSVYEGTVYEPGAKPPRPKYRLSGERKARVLITEIALDGDPE